MGKKLLEKSSLIVGARLSPFIAQSPVDEMAKPKTAPGTMLQFIGQQSETVKELEILRDHVKSFEGARPAKQLDPKLVKPSRWANRHAASFENAKFKSLMAEIESAGGNIQPIKVRPIGGTTESYEIVFGHRRHQACLQLGLPVLAVVEEMADTDLFCQMDRENRQRADLRPYEIGVMYARAMDEGLFPSAKKLSEKASVDLTYLGRAIALARLPRDVLDAFRSPLDLQFRWAGDLTKALQQNPEMVLEAAKRIKSEAIRPPPADIFRMLTLGNSTVLPPAGKKIPLKGKNGQSGVLSLDPKSKSVQVNFSNIDPQRFKEVQSAIQAIIS